MAEFEGKGASLQAALDVAVSKALDAKPGGLIFYTVRRITGSKGGFTGAHQSTVVIDSDFVEKP
jgi:hypothetical protein